MALRDEKLSDHRHSTNRNDEDEQSNDSPTALLDEIYNERIIEIQQQMEQLKNGTHAEYVKQLMEVEEQQNNQLIMNKLWRNRVSRTIEIDYHQSCVLIHRKHEMLKHNLEHTKLLEMSDRKKAIEQDNSYVELSPDSSDIKPNITRKLRRRPNEPPITPVSIPQDKRRKQPSLLNISYSLKESEIETDVKVIQNLLSHVTSTSTKEPKAVKKNDSLSSCVKNTKFIKSTSSAGKNNSSKKIENFHTKESLSLPSVSTTKIEDGKLLFEKIWYHRGQQVFVDGTRITKFSGVITKIGNEVIWVKKISDNSKFRIKLSSLSKRKMSIKRRATF